MNSNIILYCIPSMGGGGAERQLTYISEGLVKKEWDVHVALIRGGPNLERLKSAGAKIHRLYSRSNYDPIIFWQLIKIINQIRPNIIQTWLPQMDVLGGFAASYMKVPFVLTERTSEENYKGNWKDNLRLYVGKKAVAIVSNSEGGNAYWEDKNIKVSLKKIIPNCIPFSQIEETANNDPILEIPPDSELIMFAGRFSPEKNLLNLTEAIRQVLLQRQNSIAVLFGEGPVVNDIIEFQNKYKMSDRFWVRGFTTKLWSWLKRANVFVSVSYFEGHPNVVLEAVACQCPVVISDIKAHREFLDDNSAFWAAPSSPDSIASGIIGALSMPESAKMKACCAYHKIADLTKESHVQAYLNLYETILNKQC